MRSQKTVLRLKAMQLTIGLSKSAIYSRMDQGSKYFDPEFPRPIKLGNGRAIGFLDEEVQQWLSKRIDARNA